MAIVPTIKSPVSRPEAVGGERPTSPPQPSSRQSGIRDVNAPEVTQALELLQKQRPREVMTPPPFTLEAIAAQYAGLTHNDADVLHAMQAGDLPQAAVLLVQENFRLRKEIESSQIDFDELRAASIAQQEQADARLAVADDQRLELLEQLERTRVELFELESRCEQMRLEYENELQTLRERLDR
jgi:hypothetical protein